MQERIRKVVKEMVERTSKNEMGKRTGEIERTIEAAPKFEIDESGREGGNGAIKMISKNEVR